MPRFEWISSRGQYIERFEKAFAEFCGVKHKLSCTNGTVALHLSMLALDIGPGDEGIDLMNRPVINGTPAGAAVSLERQLFPSLIGSGLFGFKAEGRFLVIGTPESCVEAQRFFA